MLERLNELLFTLPYIKSLIIVIALMLAIASIAVFAKHLTLDGAVAAVVIGFAVMWSLRLQGFILFILYFVLANLAGHWTKHQDNKEKKGSNRDCIQVMANGFWPCFAAVLYFFTSEEKALVLFATTISSSFSDTLAGDFGRLSRQTPVSIRTFMPVEKGTSGGVTFLGLAAGLLSSALISVFYGLLFGFTLNSTLVIIFGGFCGCLVDSFLGATCQVMYKDNITGMITEKPNDSTGRQNNIVRGVRWIDNDTVNFLSNTFAGIFALTLSFT